MNNLLRLVISLPLTFCTVGCAKPPITEVATVTENASVHPEITAEFIQFDTDPDAGRVADFTLTNDSAITVLGFRGTITGTNANGEPIYEFPWSKIATPEIAKPNSKTILENIGFQIPDDVTHVRFIFKEFDLDK